MYVMLLRHILENKKLVLSNIKLNQFVVCVIVCLFNFNPKFLHRSSKTSSSYRLPDSVPELRRNIKS